MIRIWSAEDFVFGAIIAIAVLGGLALLVLRWDYNTGMDTGYISAVDKMTLTNDSIIYLRRRPLNSAISYKDAEEDEHKYCTTAEHQDVIEKAYAALESGKRVSVVYSEPRPIGFVKIGGCNQAPITDIKILED